MSLLDSLIGVIAPHNCLGCGAEGSLICKFCAQTLPPPQEIAHLKQLDRVQAATLYQGAAKDLVWKLKSSGAQAAAKVIAALILQRVGMSDSLIVPVPTATSRVRQRGYDQSKLLAKALARQSGLPYLNCLGRTGQAHQVGASREQRLRQLNNAYYVKKPRLIRGASITLVDDVVTTGSTLETVAQVLKIAGATNIQAIVFAQAK